MENARYFVTNAVLQFQLFQYLNFHIVAFNFILNKFFKNSESENLNLRARVRNTKQIILLARQNASLNDTAA